MTKTTEEMKDRTTEREPSSRLPRPATAELFGSWQWLLALFTIAGFVEAAFYGQIISLTPLYLPQLGIAEADVRTWIGWMAAMASAIGIPLLPFWGALADRYARKPIIVRSFVAHLIAALGMLLAPNIWLFILGRAASSFALGNSGLMMTTLAERTPSHRVGLAFSIMNSAPGLGLFLGPLVGGRLFDAFGFRTVFAGNAVLMTAIMLMMAFGYRDTYQGTNRGSILRMAVDSVLIISGSRRLRALFPALFLLFAGWALSLNYLPLTVAIFYRGTNPGTAVGIVSAAGGLAALLCGPIIGALADRFGHWRVAFAGAILEVILWPLPALAGGLSSFVAAWALLNGVASGVFALSFSLLSGSTSSKTRGRVMSFAYLPVNLGSGVGPALGALVTGGSVLSVFPASAVITLLGIGTLLIARRQPTGS